MAILQFLVWLFVVPIVCRRYVWDNVFGAVIAAYPNYGMEIAIFLSKVPVPPIVFVGYNLVMLPIYAGNVPFFEQYRILMVNKANGNGNGNNRAANNKATNTNTNNTKEQQQQSNQQMHNQQLQTQTQQYPPWPWFDPSPEVREDFWKLSHRSIKLSALNMLVIVPLMLATSLYLEKKRNSSNSNNPNNPFLFDTGDEHWPSTFDNVRDICTMTVLHELGFYATHRLVHAVPFLYRYHKTHHEYKINTTLASQHNHPVDYTLCIAAPFLLSVAAVPKSHSISQFQFALLALYTNLDDHVGYAFPWSMVRWYPLSAATEEHEFHHSKNKGCYASKLSVCNTLFGGYQEYNRFYYGDNNINDDGNNSSNSKKKQL